MFVWMWVWKLLVPREKGEMFFPTIQTILRQLDRVHSYVLFNLSLQVKSSYDESRSYGLPIQ